MEIIKGKIGERVHDYLRRLVPFGFAGAVLISQDGEILLNHGYSLADRSTRTPNHAQTVFNLGSVTKQFTAAGILRLEMKNKLSMEDSIARFFQGVPSDKKQVTIHHLLTHTAGTPLYTGEDYEAAGRDETVEWIFSTPLSFEPGSAYRYSNAGYSLLAAVTEVVSGQEYEAFLAEQLFYPSGMYFTGYRLPAWEKASLARGYVNGQDRGIPIEKIYPSWNVMGNGEMLSTTGDLYRWHLALKGEGVLSGAAKAKLWTPFLQDYAYGWRVHETELGRIVEHNGAGDTGMSAHLRWHTGPDVLIVLFGNQSLSNGSLPILVFDEKLSGLVFGRPIRMPPMLQEVQEPEDQDLYLGAYRLEEGEEFTLLQQADGLVLHADNQPAIDLVWGVSPEESLVLQEYSRRAEIAFGSLIDGDDSFLITELGDPARAARFRDYIEQVLLEEGQVDGSSSRRTWKVLGTLPAGDETRPTTMMVVQAGDNSGTLEILWEMDRVHGLRAREARYPAGIPIRPKSRDRFVGYDVLTDRAVEVEFKRKPGKTGLGTGPDLNVTSVD